MGTVKQKTLFSAEDAEAGAADQGDCGQCKTAARWNFTEGRAECSVALLRG